MAERPFRALVPNQSLSKVSTFAQLSHRQLVRLGMRALRELMQEYHRLALYLVAELRLADDRLWSLMCELVLLSLAESQTAAGRWHPRRA